MTGASAAALVLVGVALGFVGGIILGYIFCFQTPAMARKWTEYRVSRKLLRDAEAVIVKCNQAMVDKLNRSARRYSKYQGEESGLKAIPSKKEKAAKRPRSGGDNVLHPKAKGTNY
jgi:hypothetical protein